MKAISKLFVAASVLFSVNALASVEVTDFSIRESGTTAMVTITATFSGGGASGKSYDFDWETRDGDPPNDAQDDSGDNDYKATGGTVSLSFNSPSTMVPVTITQDLKFEEDEGFFVDVALVGETVRSSEAQAEGTIRSIPNPDDSGEGTIEDDDTQFTVNVDLGGGPEVDIRFWCDSGEIDQLPGPVLENTKSTVGGVAMFDNNNHDAGVTCDAEQVGGPPDGFYEVSSDCNPGLDEGVLECQIVNAPTEAKFRVFKDFNDGNPMGAYVAIECNTGLPLNETATVYEAEGYKEFIVQDFTDGQLSCEITEDPIVGYTTIYESGVDDPSAISCDYRNVGGGENFECLIRNNLNLVDLEVDKIWFDDRPLFENPTNAKARWYCTPTANLDDDSSSKKKDSDCEDRRRRCRGYDECGTFRFYEDPDSASEEIYPHYEGTICHVEERTDHPGVITDDSDCDDLLLLPGIGDSCVIENTRFYEGIPTLSQYGLMILALLMLGVGFVSVRRLS